MYESQDPEMDQIMKNIRKQEEGGKVMTNIQCCESGSVSIKKDPDPIPAL